MSVFLQIRPMYSQALCVNLTLRETEIYRGREREKMRQTGGGGGSIFIQI